MQSNMFTLALALVSYSIQFLRIVYWSRKLSAKKKAGGKPRTRFQCNTRQQRAMNSVVAPSTMFGTLVPRLKKKNSR